MRGNTVNAKWLPGRMYADFADMRTYWPETRCPDLGDWSDTPHDQLDDLYTAGLALIHLINRQIDLDRERLIAYNNT
jgi:hypothetical protein